MGWRENPAPLPRVVFCAVFLGIGVLGAGAARARYGGGSGTAEDPYLIWTAEQMNTIGLHRDDWDKHFTLMADLDLSAYQGSTFNIIGDFAVHSRITGNYGFGGVFDGQNHTIANFTYLVDVNQPGPISKYGTEFPALSGVGLFRFVWLGGEIRNLGLIDPLVEPAPTCKGWVTRFGALVGQMDGASLTNCYVEGGRVAADSAAGGLVGHNTVGVISGCHTSCDVAYAAGRTLWPWRSSEKPFPSGFGGLVGDNEGEIRGSYALGAVRGYWSTGGLVGRHRASARRGTIVDCFAIGPVSGTLYVGGLVGDNAGYLLGSYAGGQVDGEDYLGGLVGTAVNRGGLAAESFMATMEDCYATGAVHMPVPRPKAGTTASAG